MRGNLFDSAVMKTSVISEEFRRRYLNDPQQPDVFEEMCIRDRCTRARQTLGAIGGLDDFVALISKQGDEQLSIERYVIHYQYCCHPAADPLPLVEQCHRNGDRAVVIRLRLPHGKRRHRFP